jgi:putative transposase
MPRGLIRLQENGDFHFITFSCYRRQAHLDYARPRECFKEELERVRQRYDLAIGGYVVMPEHIHLLTSEPRHGNLAVVLQVLKQRTSLRLKLKSEPAFWQRRYFDFNIWTGEKHREKLEYIHRNPVERGLVKRPEDWPWSSFRHHETGIAGTVEIESEWTARRRENSLSLT